jgi:uncharacterized membrane protein YgcG
MSYSYKKTFFNISLFFVGALFLGVPFLTKAQTAGESRSYSYDRFDAAITVNKDTTVNVEERLTYDFVGNYHVGFRSISLKGIDRISDIHVIDGETGQPLTYSILKLGGNDPSDAGKFTTFIDNGAQNVEWYYDLSDTKHTWIIRYTVHGVLGFYSKENKDELYWNLFTNFDVPIKNVHATVTIPQPAEKRADIVGGIFSKPEGLFVDSQFTDLKTMDIVAKDIPSNGALTFAFTWPEGIVDRSGYWLDLMVQNAGILFSIVIIWGAILFAIWRWYTFEYKERQGTIIPQYDPPRNIRPAMTEVVIHERMGLKTWPATIIDLAVRGYVRIIEEEKIFKNKFLGAMESPQYKIESMGKDTADLHGYEKSFLDLMFLKNRTYFSTREAKTFSNAEKMAMSKKFKELEQALYDETNMDTQAYIVSPGKEYHARNVLGVMLIVLFYLIAYLWEIIFSSQLIMAFFALLIAAGIVVYSLNYETRLNKRGNELRNFLLGFRMYLDTAERYRMQNLTPDMFEKFLSYAIIFGIEKKWAKVFEGITTQDPTWYTPRNNMAIGGFRTGSVGMSSSVAHFSPVSFSNSFSTSFASAFSSGTSTGSHSGGGGSAGGGAGGGGGGAR